ncbi:MAG: hypothetical protein FJ148_05255 [Deltaproteobacteria bacterium]|nr:hypothetical protein [Deltaproteobacteria bacterium]
MKDVLLERVTGDPTAWAMILRHLVPIVGVLLFGWSALQSLVALFLDAWSVLLCLAAVAATWSMRGFVHDDMDLADWANLVTGGAVLFAFIGGLLGFAIAVPATMLLGAVAHDEAETLWQMLRSTSLLSSLATMLAFQVPRWWALSTRADEAHARRVVELEVGFVLVLVRTVWTGMAGLAFAVLPAGAAVLGALVAAQTVLAVTEILSDRMLLGLDAGSRTRDTASGSAGAARSARKRRRRRR